MTLVAVDLDIAPESAAPGACHKPFPVFAQGMVRQKGLRGKPCLWEIFSQPPPHDHAICFFSWGH